jgi:hypothetical protein
MQPPTEEDERMTDPARIAALADADRQYALVNATLHTATQRAAVLLATYSEVEAWALLVVEMRRQVDVDSESHAFAVEMIAAAAIGLAKPA